MVSDDIIRSLISFNVAEVAVILFLLNTASLNSNDVPIYVEEVANMVDPLPQALMITAIVIGASITALILMMSIKIFHYFGTLKWKEILEREIV